MNQKVNERFTAASKGLITEGNELAAPRDSTLDETNYERLPDLTARRRRPIIEELANRATYLPIDSPGTNLQPDELDIDHRHTSAYIWKTPAHRENVSILVEEIGNKVRFYRIDHDITEDNGNHYMRKLPFDDEIWLALWGHSGSTEVAVNDRRPCTYTEGDGSLYIFSNHAGTIRVDLVGDTNDRGPTALQFTPIGTWTRDYVGAAESSAADFRHEGVDPALPAAALFNGTPIPTNNVNVELLGSELPDDRAYNLTNTGWPENQIVEFMHTSEEDYRMYSQFKFRGAVLDPDTGRWYTVRQRNNFQYPSLQDRYLDGRTINEDGQNLFSFAQINEAQERTSEPTQGARIGSSDYHPAACLQPMPVDHRAPQTGNPAIPNRVQAQVLSSGELLVRVQFNRAQFHSNGRPESQLAVFVHQLTYQVTLRDGEGGVKNVRGGFSGVFDAERFPDIGQGDVPQFFQLQFRHDLGETGRNIAGTPQSSSETEFFGYTLFVPAIVETAWIHPAPIHTPHRLPDNGEFYDYRKQKRPTSGVFFANRLWQFGDEHDRLYYSQMVAGGNNRERNSSIARESMCYAAASPTDGEDSQIVATDGGYVYLPNSGTHFGGIVMGQNLYVFTDTGIYSVSPGGAGFFLPNDFRISKVVEAEVLGQKAFTSSGSSIYVATDQGILKINEDGIQNITQQSIQTLYRELTDATRDTEIIAVYDPETLTCRWAFTKRIRTIDPLGNPVNVGAQLAEEHTTMLSFSERHQHWYRYDLSKTGAVTDMLVLPYTIRNVTYNRYRYLCVTSQGLNDPAIASWGVELQWNEEGTDSWVEGSPTGFRDFRDTGQPEHETVQGFMLTNHQLLGDGTFFNQIDYLIAHNKNVTTHLVDLDEDGIYEPNIDGSTLCSVQWDWTDEPDWGKFTSPQETYRFRRSFITAATQAIEEARRGEPVLVAKIKIRGRGREFRILWQTQDDKDSHLVGWNITGSILPKA